MNFEIEAKEAAEICWNGVETGMILKTEKYYAQIYDELARLAGYQIESWGRCWPSMVILSIWNAGRIQGIRQERKRRRRAA